MKYRRQFEYKESQLQQAYNQLDMHSKKLINLEEELLKAYHKEDILRINLFNNLNENAVPDKVDKSTSISKPLDTELIIKVSKSAQTNSYAEEGDGEKSLTHQIMLSLQSELENLQQDIIVKDKQLQEHKSKITELEMNLNLFRKQLGDKQSQITFYEKYILQIQNRKEQEAITDSSEVNLITSEGNLQDSTLKVC